MPKLIWEKKLQEAVKVGVLLGIVNNVIPATSPATNLAKTVANTSYSLLEYLHGMQGVSGSSPLGSIRIFAKYTNYFGQ